MNMILCYDTTKRLDVARLDFSGGDDLARVVASGGRYGGCWVINLLAFTPQMTPVGYDPIGSMETVEQGTSKQAYETARGWLTSQCVLAGVRLVHAEDRNGERPGHERPYFMTGFFLIDRR